VGVFGTGLAGSHAEAVMKIDLSKKRVVIKNYERHKEELDKMCREYAWAYYIRKDGSAVLVRYLGDLV